MRPRYGAALLVMLAFAQFAHGDWLETADNSVFDQAWLSGYLPGTVNSATFSFAPVGGRLVMTDPANFTGPAGAGAFAGFGFVAQSFSNVRVSAIVNPDQEATINDQIGLIARGNPGTGAAYFFGVNWFDNVPKGGVYIQRQDSYTGNIIDLAGPILIPSFALADSLYLEFDLNGSQLAGRVYDQPGGALLVSVNAVDGTYASGYSGVGLRRDPSPTGYTNPLYGTFDDVASMVIPEPGTSLLLVMGLVGLGAKTRRRRR